MSSNKTETFVLCTLSLVDEGVKNHLWLTLNFARQLEIFNLSPLHLCYRIACYLR